MPGFLICTNSCYLKRAFGIINYKLMIYWFAAVAEESQS